MQFLPIIAVMPFGSSTVIAAMPDDSYIAGYAAGILKHQFQIDVPALIVRNGTITIPADKVSAGDCTKVVQILSEIPGVTRVEVGEHAVQRAVATASVADKEITPKKSTPEAGSTMLATGVLPEGHLFKPLLADPSWAHFSAAYRNYVGNNLDGNNHGSVSFGETIPFYRANIEQSIVQWETGIQAAVLSDFNLGASSSDLINTDFIASAHSSLRANSASAFARIYHQSSHLGDEFLLRK